MHFDVENSLKYLSNSGCRIATVESITGGLLASWLTAWPGSSNWFDRGWVVYSNAAKHQALGVPEDLMSRYGAVSEPVAIALCEGGYRLSGADIVLATTGLAGPDGDGSGLPVGRVWLGCYYRGEVHTRQLDLQGSRETVRNETARSSLTLMRQLLLDRA